mgnify:CR=1 FL=1
MVHGSACIIKMCTLISLSVMFHGSAITQSECQTEILGSSGDTLKTSKQYGIMDWNERNKTDIWLRIQYEHKIYF